MKSSRSRCICSRSWSTVGTGTGPVGASIAESKDCTWFWALGALQNAWAQFWSNCRMKACSICAQPTPESGSAKVPESRRAPTLLGVVPTPRVAEEGQPANGGSDRGVFASTGRLTMARSCKSNSLAGSGARCDSGASTALPLGLGSLGVQGADADGCRDDVVTLGDVVCETSRRPVFPRCTDGGRGAPAAAGGLGSRCRGFGGAGWPARAPL